MIYNLHFHNSIGLAQDELARAISSAKTQDKRILLLFKLQGVSMTPHEVHTTYIKYYPDCPITSIRRAMNTLTRLGKLEKTGEMKKGGYHHKTNTWRLV